jgi:hypothetical protein
VDPLQLAVPQETVMGCCWHFPAPSQEPVFPHGLLLDGAQPPCGSAVPACTLVHVPALPETLQAWQVPHEAEVQQTPSTQLPVPHSAAEAQAWPVRFLPQEFVEVSQLLGDRQSLLLVQVLLQLVVPLHA